MSIKTILLALLAPGAALAALLVPARATPTLVTPVAFDVSTCVGGRSPLVTCSFATFCSCTITDTIGVTNAPDCIACLVSGGLSCGSNQAPTPMAIPCETRHTVGRACSGGPGFGCTYNFAVVLFCGDCEPIGGG